MNFSAVPMVERIQVWGGSVLDWDIHNTTFNCSYYLSGAITTIYDSSPKAINITTQQTVIE